MPMNVSSRTRQILELLLSSDRDLTAAEIANRIRVSSRTVHRELAAAEQLLREHGIELLKKSGSGIRLQGEEAGLDRLRRKVSASEDIEFSPDERQIYILCYLLKNNEPVKLFTLAHDLKVTVPTVTGDLDALEGWVRKFGVTLIRKRGYGVELSGREERLRETVRQLIKLRLDDTELIESRNDRPVHPLDRQLFELAGKPDMGDIESILWEWEEHWTARLSEGVYTDLLIRLSIALQRMRAGKTVSAQPATEGTDDKAAVAEAGALRLTELLSRQLGIRFTPLETVYVSELLDSARLKDLSPLPGDDLALTAAIRSLTRHVQNATGIDFSEDPSLRDGLFNHLKAAVQRLSDGLRIRNPLLDQIRKDYVGLFGIVREAANVVFSDLDVPDEEVGFLVMHFGASLERLKQLRRHVRTILVCTSGIGSSKMLQARLQKEMPQIEIVDSVSWYEASRIPEDSYDFIISTIDLPLEPDRYIKVNPLLTQEEADRLRAFIRETATGRKAAGMPDSHAEKPASTGGFEQLQSLRVTLDEIVRLIEQFKVIRIREQSSELPAILEEACRYVEEAGVLTDASRVTERLLKREQSGSQMIPGTALALFHTRSPEVNRPSLTLYRLPNPVVVETVPPASLSRFLLMLAPQSLSRESLEVLSEVSVMLLDSEMIELLEAGNEAAIRNYLTVKLKAFFRMKTESE